ncbi:MAG: hypothetical protein K0S11_1147 [Gammaproteobacteria bacterium]|jgi:hypothetical protein|nr:hypothetical protein [Gammaproteobacteria bacterium]
MARRYFQETSQLYKKLETNKCLAKQALANHQQKEAASYLSNVAACWQTAASSETHFFLKQFYYHKALENIQQAQQQHPTTEVVSFIERLCSYIQPYGKKSTMYKKLNVFFNEKFLASVRPKARLGIEEQLNQQKYSLKY